jgi:chitinase
VSVFSTPVSVTTYEGIACTAKPTAPILVTATPVSGSTVNLEWDSVTPPAGCAVTYNVYRDRTGIATGLLTTSYAAGGLQPDTLYSFTVSAKDAAGESPISNPLPAKTLASGGGSSPGFSAQVFAPYVDMLVIRRPR